MTPSQRIALNTIATYTRSIIGAGLTLFSSRWILNALGQTDFGLFSVVGSIIIFITFLNTVLSGSAARHYAFSLGKGDSIEVGRWFNSALGIHLFLAIILTLSGWPVGEYVISHILTIPDDRISVCAQVFRVSLISAFISMISVPFIAMFTAKQHIAELAVWNMLYPIMTFVLAIFLNHINSDRLLFYAVAIVSILVFVQLAQIFRAIVIFHECRINYHEWFDKYRAKEIISFASWSLIGSLGAIFSNQGSAILLNLKFGPNVNAAYGIANQVSSQTKQLAASMIGAFSPEITTSEGRGERIRMLSLAQRASKFGTLLALIFSIPLMIEMDYILKIWLRQPPLYTALFCQLIIITFIIERLSAGDQLAVHATGKIAIYEIIVGTCLILTLPLAWIFLKFGAPPTSLGFAFMLTTLAFSIGRVFLTSRLFCAPVRQWVISVVIPCGIVSCITLIVALLPFMLLPESFLRLLCVASVSILTSLLTTWFFVFDKREREFIRHGQRQLLSKMTGLWNLN